jgi:hypothetical protein
MKPLKIYFIIDRASHMDIGPVKLNAYQHSLVIGTYVEPEDGTAEVVL